MKTPEEYFKMGAEAMQGRIAALLVLWGHMDIAPKILGLELPPFEEPEEFVVTKKSDGKNQNTL